jgi:uncharacterized membrane protein
VTPLTFAAPWWLLSLPLALAVWWHRGRGSGPARSRSEARPSLRVARILRTLAVVALALALAGPQWRTAGGEVDVAFLLDGSDSLSGGARQRAEEWVRDALAARGDGDRAALALFGRDARLEYALRGESLAADTAVVIDPSATDLSRAVRLGQGVLGSAHRRRAVLLTDGRETDGDVLAGAQELADAGVAVDVVLVSDAAPADVLVEAVDAPARVREGEAYDVVTTVRNTGAEDSDAILTLLADGTQVARRRITVPPGTTDVTVHQVARRSGTVRYEAVLSSGASTVAVNDRGRAAVQVAGPPKVLIYQRAAGLADDLAAALRSAGLPVDLQEAATATLPGFDELLDYDGVVLVDVPATTLGQDGMVALDTYVRQAGRGLIAIGGEQSFGMGGYDGTTIEELLPVFARVTDPKKRQSVAEALVVDTSGSMAACHCADDSLGPRPAQQEGVRKTDIAKEAIAKAVQQLEDSDQLGVLAFNTASNWVIPLQHLPADAVVDDGLARLNPNGNTDIVQGVREAIAGLRDAEARLRHIVLFSDGFMSDTSELIDVAREAADVGITLSVVGTGEGSADVLRRMAAVGGGRYYPGRDLSSIPTIIALELRMAARPIVNEGTFFPTVTAQAPVTAQLDASPPLAGYLATTAKPAAQTLLAIGEERDPLLTTWRAGLGTAVAWTSDVAPRWSAQWVTWERFSGFWADVVKSAFPDRRDTAIAVDADHGPDGLEVRLTAADEIPAGAIARITVTGPDGRTVDTTLERTAIDTFSGVVATIGGEGVYAVSASLVDGDEELHRDVVTATRSYPAEYAGVAADPARLRRLAAATGGRIDPPPAAAFDAAGLAPGSVALPLWPWLTALALVLAPADVALRRLRLERADWGRVLAWLRRGGRRPPPPPVQRDAATDALFAARARARGE